MLSFFRQGGVGQFVVGAMVFAIIIVFMLQARGNGFGPLSVEQDCAVEVSGTCVDKKDFVATYRVILGGRQIPEEVEKKLGLRGEILEGLVERELLAQEAERLGVTVTPKNVDDELQAGRIYYSLPARAALLRFQLGDGKPRALLDEPYRGKNFNFKAYERAVKGFVGRSPRQFKEQQTREIIAERMRRLIRARAVVSPTEAFHRWERENTTAQAWVTKVNHRWFATYLTAVDDAKVDAWVAAHKAVSDAHWKDEASYWSADCPMVREVRINAPSSSDQTKEGQKEKAEAVRKRLKAGEAFGAVARDASDGPDGRTGGWLGCLHAARYGSGGKELLAAVAELEVGELSDIITTPRGFHIVQLVKKVPAADLEKEARRHAARGPALDDAAKALAKQFADDLIKNAAGKSLERATEELARAYYLRVHPNAELPPIDTAETALEDLGDDDETLEQKEAAKAKLPPALTASTRPQTDLSGEFNRSSNPVDNALPTENAAAAVFDLKKVGDVHATPIATRDGFAVVQLEERTIAKREDFDKEKAELVADLRRRKADALLVTVVARLRRQASDAIKIDSRLAKAPKKE